MSAYTPASYPILAIAEIQAAALDTWGRLGSRMLESMKQFYDATESVMPLYKRNRQQDISPEGVDLLNGYGRRSHDVDAERAV
ncbi:MAG: hypothetical protein HQL37_10110 [Alphaproteobacteria bacterium]|nr:hypothetical protein [Alphaproteobacteria bacterium]